MAMKIARVDPGSEAEALGLAAGDELLSVDENELNDSLDYDFYTDSKSFHLKARVADGIREWDVQRTERGPFGCDFQTYLGDQKHSCSNHCMFCFIDQLPPGMRESLYFKDDDERLSFLFGNYITMTNMQDHEIDRIIKMHISPINISVHTTNPQLRVRMLANKRGGEVLKYLPRLVEGGIAVNCQLVLCRGINDGDELRRTLSDLLELTARSCTGRRPTTQPPVPRSSTSWKNSAMSASAAMASASSIPAMNGISRQAGPSRRRSSTRTLTSWKTAWE